MNFIKILIGDPKNNVRRPHKAAWRAQTLPFHEDAESHKKVLGPILEQFFY